MSETEPDLPIDAVARCTREAQKDGIFAGLSSGLAGAIIGSKFYRLNRNQTILCGIATGVLAGYQFTQVFLASNLARLRAEQAQLVKAQTSEPVFGDSSTG
ncbi:hypothetical protein BDY19DRAFT_908898 [Irpex rosettiformis]|uniref:Uncharacterized protein n=1 Tax=Irpex rosettiformis TaxID=378272 RepID=A0ACB8TUN5_9APHY|nr:hypothetical protein BDY19DRAFT_908898 [Irpex rosettiformis]